ncbi:hypothetical protein DFJ74DRAFT_94911 [Hyaloraphidium curvatum]|nr:hypothetical protein DFJ74DRAFT_94911 [Hyaloraphidium curvatum]
MALAPGSTASDLGGEAGLRRWNLTRLVVPITWDDESFKAWRERMAAAAVTGKIGKPLVVESILYFVDALRMRYRVVTRVHAYRLELRSVWPSPEDVQRMLFARLDRYVVAMLRERRTTTDGLGFTEFWTHGLAHILVGVLANVSDGEYANFESSMRLHPFSDSRREGSELAAVAWFTGGTLKHGDSGDGFGAHLMPDTVSAGMGSGHGFPATLGFALARLFAHRGCKLDLFCVASRPDLSSEALPGQLSHEVRSHRYGAAFGRSGGGSAFPVRTFIFTNELEKGAGPKAGNNPVDEGIPDREAW